MKEKMSWVLWLSVSMSLWIIYALPFMFCSYFIQVIKNSNGQFNLEAAIKNVETMSNELKKINGNSESTIQLNKKLCETFFWELWMAWFSVSDNWVFM